MNTICITGRVTQNPELKKTQSGVSVMALSLAVDRDYKVNNEKVTDFIPVILWRKTAEVVSQYTAKGDMLSVVGSLESRKYTDSEGNNRTVWEVKSDKVGFLSKKKQPEQNAQAQQNFTELPNDEDLPF